MKKRITISLEETILGLLDTMAESDHRTRSNEIEVLTQGEYRKRLYEGAKNDTSN